MFTLKLLEINTCFFPDKCPDDKFEKDGKCKGKYTLIKPYWNV